MKFSLVMATLGRDKEIERLFDSLCAQSWRDFEVIVIDQNEDDRVVRVIQRFSDRLRIRHLTSEKGLSRARNVGLRQADGDVVCFPDDDCWYQSDTLEMVNSVFKADAEVMGVTGCSIDEAGRYSQGRWSPVELEVDRYNVWTCATSYTIFLRREAAAVAGEFDPTLRVGSGTRWGAGEEVNYLLKVVRAGMRLRYLPFLQVHHSEPIQVMDARAYQRARMYNRGLGRVLKLNRYPVHFVAYMLLRPAMECLLSFLRLRLQRSKYYGVVLLNRYFGWAD